MSELKKQYDLVIVGSGLSALSLALLFSQQSQQTLSIAIVDKRSQPNVNTLDDFSSDTRATALSLSSQRVYEQCGIWQKIQPYAQSISRIHVSSQGHFSQAHLKPNDIQSLNDEPSDIGWVVENKYLSHALFSAVASHPNIEFLDDKKIESIKQTLQGSTLEITGNEKALIDARLLIIADGSHSPVAGLLGFNYDVHAYESTAVVSQVMFAKHHQGVAYERFTQHGPMALLPLLNDEVSNRHHRAALIWCMTDEDAYDKQVVNKEVFLRALQQQFGYKVGRFVDVGERICYPLKLTYVNEQVRRGVVVFGNAAHALHPVAGQGFNLILRDAVVLVNTILSRWNQGEELPIELPLLISYVKQQQQDQQRATWLSHWLPKISVQTALPFAWMKSAGIALVDNAPSLRQPFVGVASGLYAGGNDLRS